MVNCLSTNIFDPLLLTKNQVVEHVDIFSLGGKKTITLSSYSNLTYLVVASDAAIDIEIVTQGPCCSCKIFGLFVSDKTHHIASKINVSLKHPHTSADVDLISFLYDGANITLDGSIDISPCLQGVSGRLLEQNIVLGKNISVKNLPQLMISSFDVHASHGAKIDSLDIQKLFYMMSRGLTKKQSQELLIDGYITSVLSHFPSINSIDSSVIFSLIKK